MTNQNESTITCGACTVAIGEHTRRDNCRLESLIETAPHHFFATMAFGWATSEVSREDALSKLASRFRGDCQRVIRNSKKEGGEGMYFWSCIVEGDAETANYEINFYQPVGVETRDHQEHNLTRVTLKVSEFSRILHCDNLIDGDESRGHLSDDSKTVVSSGEQS